MPQADPYAAELLLLLDHARAAGEIARVHHRTDVATWEKDGGAGPVTEADIAIDRMLKAELTRAEPDYGWLSEETEDDVLRCEADRAFIVDPIDGTRAFMRGDDSFCHALAVVDKGEVVAACAFSRSRTRCTGRRRVAAPFAMGSGSRPPPERTSTARRPCQASRR